MKKFKLKGKDNRGSTIIIVLIAMAMVGILATMVLTMAVSNLQMKRVDKGAKTNFYSAEVALDELRTGLEGEITKIVESTYTKIMLEYASLPIGDRSQAFKESLAYSLSTTFDASKIVKESNFKNINTKYNLDLLKNYLVDTKEETTISAKNGQNILECLFVASDPEKQYICFRNLTLGYTQAGTNFYTQITTDIKIKIPNASFEAISVRPSYTEYAVIANRQLLADNGESGSVEGSVYAGNYGILTRLGATLNFNSDQIVVEDNITTNEGGNITIDDLHPSDGMVQSNIWAKNIVTTAASSTTGIAAKLNIKGNLYIADDVTIDAPNSNIKLSGSYYGYGYGDSPQTSSAMIVNRNKSLLDLSDLDNIFIAGRAYIEPVESIIENTSESSGVVLTGEAISSKGNQLAYLLPGNAIGVHADGKSVGHNPLSLSEYDALQLAMKTDSSILEVDSNYLIGYSGKKLSYYVDPIKPFNRIFDRTNTSTLVYYYPNFKSEAMANEYFKDYISNSDNYEALVQRLEDSESHIRLPKNIINNSASGRKTYAGNIVAYSDDLTPTLYMYNNTVDAKLANQYTKEADDLKTLYEAYKLKLVPSVTGYTKADLDPDNLFDRLMVKTSGDPSCPGIYELISGKTMGPNHSYLFDDTSYSAYGKFILVTNTKTTAENVFDSTTAFKVDSNISPDVHIIIATGDVEVSANFNGIIISNGIVKIKNGAKITANAKKVFDLICYSPVRTIFRDYNSFPIYLTDNKEKQIDVSSLIIEENWSKN